MSQSFCFDTEDKLEIQRERLIWCERPKVGCGWLLRWFLAHYSQLNRLAEPIVFDHKNGPVGFVSRCDTYATVQEGILRQNFDLVGLHGLAF